MSALLWLCGVLAALWLLGVLLSRHVQGLVLLLSGSPRIATATYDMLVLPGVVLHELSHVVVALLLGMRVLSINLFQFRSQGDVRQGEVVVVKVDPLRMSLVGAAPLFGGIAALLLMVQWLDAPALGFDLKVFDQIRPLLAEPAAALGLYLLVAIANTMFPSEADRRAWWVVGAALLAVTLILLALGVRPDLPPQWLGWLTTQADRLSTMLLPVVVIDVVVLTIVIVLETTVSRIRGRRVVYRSSRS